MPYSIAILSREAGRGALDSSRFSAFQGGGVWQNGVSAFVAAGHCSEVAIADDKSHEGGREGDKTVLKVIVY